MICIKNDHSCQYYNKQLNECIPGYCQITIDAILYSLNQILDKFEHINKSVKLQEQLATAPITISGQYTKFGPDNNKPLRDDAEQSLRNVNKQLKKRGRPKNKFRSA